MKTSTLKIKKNLSLKIFDDNENIQIIPDNPERSKFNKKNTVTQIDDIIYLSGASFSLNSKYLYSNNYTHIINCAYLSKQFQSLILDNVKYLLLDIKDDPLFNLEAYFYKAIEFIEEVKRVKGKLLIHCYEVSLIFNQLN